MFKYLEIFKIEKILFYKLGWAVRGDDYPLPVEMLMRLGRKQGI